MLIFLSLIIINNINNIVIIITIKIMKNKIELILTSGDGGAGCVSFRKEKFVSRGGPDGGDGGNGGDVVLIPDKNMYNLDCFYDQQKFKASSGEPGGKKNKNGRRGNDLEITLPFACEIKTKERNFILNKKYLLIKGGEKGRGNIKFKSSINQEPLLAEYGENGTTMKTEIKSNNFPEIAIIGESNSGKSWLLNKLTNSKTKEAKYVFTTQKPFVAQLKNNIKEVKIIEIPDFFNFEKAEKFIPLLKDMKAIMITVPENCEDKEYIEKKLVKLKGKIANTCKLIGMETWINNNELNHKNLYANYNKKNFMEVKKDLLNTQKTESMLTNNGEEYTHNPKVINQNKLYSYFSKTNTINVLDNEIIRIAKGSNLNKPETQFQFHNVLNKKGFFKQIKNDEIKKGAIIIFENIELEYK